MRALLFAVLSFACLVGVMPVVASADDDPLFVNMTTDDAHRARMALVFSSRQHERSHPVTIFLNDRGVLVASKKHADKFKVHHEAIANLIKNGGTVLICPMCMKHYGVEAGDLIEGVKLSNPELAGAALFADDSRTLTW
jgi:predicted peroxiredoxin